MGGCPDTTSIVGGSTEGDDEVGDAPAPGDEVEDHRTYFIGESTQFDGGGACDNKNLNTVTSTLRTRLDNASWQGQRLLDDEAWPEDFREQTVMAEALDGVHADAARLAIYAGHGGVGQLQWGRPSDNDQCATTLSDQVRLGTLTGDRAAATMFMTSCTLRVDKVWATLGNNACRQFFGYHNSPHIGFDEARKVFKRTEDGQSTVAAWLEEMVHNVNGNNSPVAFTMGVSAAEAALHHANTNLATGEGYMQNVGEPPEGYVYEWFNNGCTVSCGGCDQGAGVVPQISLGTPAPRLALTRPQRSSEELLGRAQALLGLFEVGVASAGEQARLAAWASAIASSGDVTHAWIVDEPRIDLTYDPQTDELRITDRSALERARPQPAEAYVEPPELAATLRTQAQGWLALVEGITGLLDPLAAELEGSTRELGFGGVDEAASTSTAYEYLFTLPGLGLPGLGLPELELADRSLTIGVTRLGELSTIVIRSVEVEVIGPARVMQTPQQALDRLRAAIQAESPQVVEIEFVDPRVGYALIEDQISAPADPSLLVSYVLTFGKSEPMTPQFVSRSVPVAISLVEPDAPIRSRLALDPDPRPGDPRVANLD